MMEPLSRINFIFACWRPVCYRPATYLGPNFTFEKTVLFLRGISFGLSAYEMSHNLEIDFLKFLQTKYSLTCRPDISEIYQMAYPKADDADRLLCLAVDLEIFAQTR